MWNLSVATKRASTLVAALAQNGAAVDEKYYTKPFQFLSLGAMAYIGRFQTTASARP